MQSPTFGSNRAARRGLRASPPLSTARRLGDGPPGRLSSFAPPPPFYGSAAVLDRAGLRYRLRSVAFQAAQCHLPTRRRSCAADNSQGLHPSVLAWRLANSTPREGALPPPRAKE